MHFITLSNLLYHKGISEIEISELQNLFRQFIIPVHHLMEANMRI